MSSYYLPDEEWIALWKECGSAVVMSQKTGISQRSVYNRRRSIEARHKIELTATDDQRFDPLKKVAQTTGHTRRGMEIEKGNVIVFSDAHFWPDDTTTAFKALLEMIKEHKPTAIVCNGDALDGANLSRFPRQDWNKVPTVKEELEACQYYLGEIEAVAKGAKLFLPMGNHDQRL